MSTARIDKMLQDSSWDFIPVPRLPVDIKEDSISRRLRRFDNARIQLPPPAQSGIYINTNELGSTDTATALAKIPLIIQPCHIGFSGWHNFDIMAQRFSERALICDINPENALFLYYVLKNVRLCKNRFEFIKQMSLFIKEKQYVGSRENKDRNPLWGQVGPSSINFSLNVNEEEPYTDHFSVVEEVELELQRTTSWLYTDERYAHIKKLAQGDKIALITENICAAESFADIARILRDNAIQVDTVYVSNIGEWMNTEKERNLFIKTTQSFLSDPETILIDGRSVYQNCSLPKQRSITKKEFTLLNPKDWFFTRIIQTTETRKPEAETSRLSP